MLETASLFHPLRLPHQPSFPVTHAMTENK